jgi:hypothetical protein
MAEMDLEIAAFLVVRFGGCAAFWCGGWLLRCGKTVIPPKFSQQGMLISGKKRYALLANNKRRYAQ